VSDTTVLTLVEVLILFTEDISTGFELILLGIAAEGATKIEQVILFLDEPVQFRR
jgi:hypothetical protein